LHRSLAGTLVRLQDHRAAAKVAAELARTSFDPVEDPYNAACLVTLCVPLAKQDTGLPEHNRSQLAEEYAEQAMDLLREVVQRGFKDAEHMKKDPDLDPLRARDDFKKLMAVLEEKKW
jgi:hypothetical protein